MNRTHYLNGGWPHAPSYRIDRCCSALVVGLPRRRQIHQEIGIGKRRFDEVLGNRWKDYLRCKSNSLLTEERSHDSQVVEEAILRSRLMGESWERSTRYTSSAAISTCLPTKSTFSRPIVWWKRFSITTPWAAVLLYQQYFAKSTFSTRSWSKRPIGQEHFKRYLVLEILANFKAIESFSTGIHLEKIKAFMEGLGVASGMVSEYWPGFKNFHFR